MTDPRIGDKYTGGYVMRKPKSFWLQIVVAAGMVLMAGVAITMSAQEVRVEVLKAGDEEIEIRLDDSSETVRLEDLADGEERTFGTSEHPVTVRRNGDQLEVLLDGKEIGVGGCLHRADKMLWIGDEDHEGDGVRKIVMLKSGEDMAEEIIELRVDMIKERLAGAGLDDLDLSGLDQLLVEGGDHDPHLIRVDATHHVLADGKKRVRYRCEETGSMLVIDADQATGDTYICPATGCVMEKVEEPEVKVIKIQLCDGDDEESEE